LFDIGSLRHLFVSLQGINAIKFINILKNEIDSNIIVDNTFLKNFRDVLNAINNLRNVINHAGLLYSKNKVK
jgi:hypothetical protein